jgi:NAD+ diphosphatase
LRDEADWAAAQRADPDARFLVLGEDHPGGRRALVDAASDGLRWLTQVEYECLDIASGRVSTYLGQDETGPLFSLGTDAVLAARLVTEFGGAFIDLRSAGMRLPAFQAGVFAYARAIAHWQARTRYCSACGSPLELVALGHRGKCTNPDCALEHFPRVDPAMIVIVNWRDQCLLGSQ